MDVKNKTREELEKRIGELENIIARKGVGAQYVKKVERIQRDINLALILSGTAAVVGLATWALLKSRGDED